MRNELDIILPFVFFMNLVLGVGYIVARDMTQQELQFNACIDSGKQYSHGDCLK